ncbi:putative ribonuclease H-like domain-containing protein [Tanacetum coccineum]
MSTSNQQTLADSKANERPQMLEKWNYIPWESRFRRFLDNKLEEGYRMWRSIKKGPYVRPMISKSDKPTEQIIEPFSKMTESNKKQYIADVKVMNYLLQVIPNDIYNSVDACKNAKDMWERIKRLMFGSDVTSHVRHSRLMDEFDKFAAKEGESLESVYERLTSVVNIMDRNNVRPIPVSINTKFILPCMSHILHPLLTYEDEYQGELQGDSQEDKLTTAMMLLARAITQKFSIPTNNRLRTSSNIRNQAANVQCCNYNEKGHYARDCQKPRVRDAKYFREQMLLAMKDESRSNVKDEENDFMLDNSYGDETLTPPNLQQDSGPTMGCY